MFDDGQHFSTKRRDQEIVIGKNKVHVFFFLIPFVSRLRERKEMYTTTSMVDDSININDIRDYDISDSNEAWEPSDNPSNEESDEDDLVDLNQASKSWGRNSKTKKTRISDKKKMVE